MFYLTKGMKLEQFIGSNTGIMFDITETGGVLFFVVDEKDLRRFKLGGHYDFWCAKINETLFFAVKLRDNEWMSSPYTPHLSQGYKPRQYPTGNGLPLTVALVSAKSGIIKDMDFIGLGNAFSNAITEFNKEILSKKFYEANYEKTIDDVFQKFPTDEELVKQPGVTYSID